MREGELLPGAPCQVLTASKGRGSGAFLQAAFPDVSPRQLHHSGVTTFLGDYSR